MPAGKIINKRFRINRTHGLFIGINQYLGGGIPALQGCVRDAKDLMEAFRPDQPQLLMDEAATRKGILAAINEYIKSLSKGDLLILTVSGHGAFVNKDLALIPYDAENDNLLGTALSTLYLINALSTISENGGKVLIILDICHSGALPFDLSKYSGALSGGGISSIYACGPNETAKESQFAGETRGIFTKFFIDGLNGAADLEQQQVVTLRDLYDYVYQNVCAQVSDQHPALIGTLAGNTILRNL